MRFIPQNPKFQEKIPKIYKKCPKSWGNGPKKFQIGLDIHHSMEKTPLNPKNSTPAL
jgi:hypothetical protein